jgi:ferredoxin
MNEEKQICQSIKRSSWAKPVLKPERCVSCGACLEACPVNVLAFDDSEGHKMNLLPYL